jgi:hypothetical protein
MYALTMPSPTCLGKLLSLREVEADLPLSLSSNEARGSEEDEGDVSWSTV